MAAPGFPRTATLFWVDSSGLLSCRRHRFVVNQIKRSLLSRQTSFNERLYEPLTWQDVKYFLAVVCLVHNVTPF